MIYVSHGPRENIDTASDPELAKIKNIPKGAFNQGYYKRFFRETRRLGRGARGSVFLAHHVLEDEVLGEYAVKKVPVGDNTEWLQRMLKEVHIMESLRNPHVVAYKHTWLEICQLSPFVPAVPCLFILMEYANGGSLEDFVLSDSGEPNNSFLSLSMALKAFVGICDGLEHLHSQGILHRDLKPSNILLDYSADAKLFPNLLISDFGECNTISDIRTTDRTGATGTIEFCAPELFRTDKRGQYLYDHSMATDSWSLGMILYFLLYGGQLPYPNIDDVDILREDMLSLRSIKLPTQLRKDIPKDLAALLSHLLSLEPERRPSASEARIMTSMVLEALQLEERMMRSPMPLLSSNQAEPKQVHFNTTKRRLSPSLPLLIPLMFFAFFVAGCYPKSLSAMSMFPISLTVISVWADSLWMGSLSVILWAALHLYFFGSLCAC